MIFAGVVFLFCLTIPETFAPVLLQKRAAKLRSRTGRDDIVTEQEIFRTSFADLIADTLIRPFGMLVTEPILLLMSLFIALIYGLLVRPYVVADRCSLANRVNSMPFSSLSPSSSERTTVTTTVSPASCSVLCLSAWASHCVSHRYWRRAISSRQRRREAALNLKTACWDL